MEARALNSRKLQRSWKGPMRKTRGRARPWQGREGAGGARAAEWGRRGNVEGFVEAYCSARKKYHRRMAVVERIEAQEKENKAGQGRGGQGIGIGIMVWYGMVWPDRSLGDLK